MSTTGKVVLLLLIIISIFSFLLYKGHHIIPVIDMEKSISFKGNPVLTIRIEMTTLLNGQELYDKQEIETLKKENK